MSDYLSTLSQLGQSGTPLPQHPDEARIETFPNRFADNPYVIEFGTEEFTSLCEKTRQPDFGEIRIQYMPRERVLESKSLKLFLGSYRNVPMFYESLVNDIAGRLYDALEPEWLEVSAQMAPRGGLALRVTVRRGVRES